MLQMCRLPLSLAGASTLTYSYNRQSSQSNRELSLVGGVIALHWLLHIAGVTNIQIHTHVFAGILASFGYWRYTLGDKKNAIIYIQWAYWVVTVPLAIAGLSDASTYGLALIVEQVIFMVIGASTPLRFLLIWGIWVGAGAVLFMMSWLGWLLLGPLAIILIGVAIYRLLRHGDIGQN